jgi:hypothetical protein
LPSAARNHTLATMNARLAPLIDEACAALSAADQDRLADLIEAYLASRTPEPDFTEHELAEIRRRHDEPFDPAPGDEVREFFARHRG